MNVVEYTYFGNMEIVKAKAAFLSNFEVFQMLQEIKDSTHKKQTRDGSLATVTYETLRYLQDTDCKHQNVESMTKFLDAMKEFKITKAEKLMMVNTPPRTELEIQLIVQESEERLSEEDVKNIITICKKYL